jgi:hypothetical protein
MSHVRIEFSTDGAAFRDDDDELWLAEVDAVLAVARSRIIVGEMAGVLRDSNGNTVGKFVVDEEPP